MAWESDIAGCFGIVDQIFAGHPLDEQRALKLLVKLHQEQIPWEDVTRAFERYLKDRGCVSGHIKEQMARIERHYGPWLG